MTRRRAIITAPLRPIMLIVAMLASACLVHARQDSPARDDSTPPPATTAVSAAMAQAGHGWLTWRDPDDRVTSLIHLPPRTPPPIRSESGELTRPNTDGAARLAPGFAQVADALAWCSQRAFILLREDRTGAAPEVDWKRRVLGVTALRSPVGNLDAWEYPPGRPELIATLPARGIEVVSFAATRLGPAALIRHAQRSKWIVPTPDAPPVRAGDLELLAHVGGSWRRVALPADVLAAASAGRPDAFWLWGQDAAATGPLLEPSESPGVIPLRDRLSLLALDQAAGRLRAFSIGLPARLAATDRVLQPVWRVVDYPTRDAAGEVLPVPSRVCIVDGVVIAVVESPGECQFYAWPQAPWDIDPPSPIPPATRLAPITGLTARRAVVPMDGSGRIAIVFEPEVVSPAPGDPAAARADRRPAPTSLEIREVSVTTGKVLFAGPLKSAQWLGFREYQVLAVLLVLIMAAVVIFVLRPDTASAAQLPVGVMLAEPSRRLLAVFIDYLPAAILVESIASLPTGTLFLPSRVVTEEFSLGWLAVALGLAGLQATIGECLFGRSLGKLLTGSAVASIRVPRPVTDAAAAPASPASTSSRDIVALSRPAPWQCIVRNVVKWGVPFVGIFILFDARRRHPGDLLARTVVLLTEVQSPPRQR